MTADAPENPQVWLDHFAAAVRENRVEDCRRLFAADVVGYGTRTVVADGLDLLVREQWVPTWRRIDSWTVQQVDVLAESDGTAVIAFRWLRRNTDGPEVGGRATLALRRTDGRWLCHHSHFSADPDPSDGQW